MRQLKYRDVAASAIATHVVGILRHLDMVRGGFDKIVIRDQDDKHPGRFASFLAKPLDADVETRFILRPVGPSPSVDLMVRLFSRAEQVLVDAQVAVLVAGAQYSFSVKYHMDGDGRPQFESDGTPLGNKFVFMAEQVCTSKPLTLVMEDD